MPSCLGLVSAMLRNLVPSTGNAFKPQALLHKDCAKAGQDGRAVGKAVPVPWQLAQPLLGSCPHCRKGTGLTPDLIQQHDTQTWDT